MLYSIIFMSFYGVLSLSHVTLTVYFVIMFYMIICSVLFVHGTVPFPSTFEEVQFGAFEYIYQHICALLLLLLEHVSATLR